MVEARHTELVNPSQPHRQSLTKNGEAVMGMTGLTNQSRPEIGKKNTASALCRHHKYFRYISL